MCAYCGEKPVKKMQLRFCSYGCASAYRQRHSTWVSRGPAGYDLGVTRRHNSGYILMKVGTDVPGADAHGWMFEHRYVAQQTAGRVLEPHERVHHKDGDRTNNSPDNLEIWKKKDPYGVRAADYHCPGCRCKELGYV